MEVCGDKASWPPLQTITRLRTRDVTLIEAVCMDEVRRVGGVSAFVLRQIAYLLPHRRRLRTRLAVSKRDCVCVYCKGGICVLLYTPTTHSLSLPSELTRGNALYVP